MSLHQDMTLADLLRVLWRAKVYLVVGSILAGLCAFGFLKVTTAEYRSSMIVAPADGYALGDYASSIKEALSVYLQRNVQISPIGASPLRRINYRHADSEFASALLRKIHLVADQMIRRDRRQQSQSRVDYLQNVLGKTVHPDHRKGITDLLMQQEHIQMLANLDEAYAAIIVEPANTGPEADWPNPTLVWAIAIFVGLLLGFVVWSFRHSKEQYDR